MTPYKLDPFELERFLIDPFVWQNYTGRCPAPVQSVIDGPGDEDVGFGLHTRYGWFVLEKKRFGVPHIRYVEKEYSDAQKE